MRRFRSILLGVLAVLVIATVAFLVWANMVMQGERERAIEVWNDGDITITSHPGSITLSPNSGATGEGLLFIPGAKVDPYAYMYKLSGLVDAGLTVVISEPTLNLAFFDARAVADFAPYAPGVTTWYVGGHSLGGVRACMLADSPDVAGLILFGSYCANDLSSSGLAVLSISGTNDGLSTPEKIAGAASFLPGDATFVDIFGANHASFGDYGVQPGDGTATVTTEEVRDRITSEVEDFLSRPRG
jgi:hypothetical protein